MFAWTRAVATEMEMMLLNINETIKSSSGCSCTWGCYANTASLYIFEDEPQDWDVFPKWMAMRAVRGIQLAVQIHCMPGWLTCFWQHGTSWERKAGDEEARQATQCYQRLHVFSLENQNLFQSPHRASESVRVLNKRNEWNRWALSLVMSALVALAGFSRVSKAIPSFALFCFVLI